MSLKKRYFLDFLSYFSSRGRILLFHMCFGIRILSPFHLAIQKVSIQNLNCPKNACEDKIFIPALWSEDWAGIKIMSNMCWKKHLTEFIIIPWIRAALYTVFNIYLQKSLHEYSIKSDGLRIFDILTADIICTWKFLKRLQANFSKFSRALRRLGFVLSKAL